MNSATDKPGRQAEKSAAMRDRVAEGTIQCLIEHGYARTTFNRVADKAGISIGAISHHFRDKVEMIKHAVGYLMEQRRRSLVAKLNDIQSASDPLEQSVEVYWEHLTDESFIAVHELVFASRTAPELKAIVAAELRKDEEIVMRIGAEYFPNWGKREDLKTLTTDYSRFLLEGMAVYSFIGGDERRMRAVRDFFKKQLKALLGT